MDGKDISKLRINYHKFELREENIPKNPLKLFGLWFNDAINGKVLEPNAMVLSTVSGHKPHARVVLLKGFSDRGFEFYTNYTSDKGKQLAENPFAALTFFYDQIERQIRIEGEVVKMKPAESDAYFGSRPRESRIGAWVSHQSSEIFSREILEEQLKKTEARFENEENIPRPDFWGGYLVIPNTIEFWQGRPSRLHDRILYSKDENGGWSFKRLSP